MNNAYNDYGFCEDNTGVVKSNVKGIEDKIIGNVYTLREEERAWKKELKQHIINEHEETREKVNEHTTDEVTEAKNDLMDKLDDIDAKLNTASINILAIKNEQGTQTNLLNTINTKIRSIIPRWADLLNTSYLHSGKGSPLV